MIKLEKNIIIIRNNIKPFCFIQGCKLCDCALASESSQCDENTGMCRCKPGVAGRTCDRCKPGYWNYTEEGCICN